MKCQTCFLGKCRNKIKMSSAENFTQSAKRLQHTSLNMRICSFGHVHPVKIVIIAQDKWGYPPNIFFISPQTLMLWVLFRGGLVRCF